MTASTSAPTSAVSPTSASAPAAATAVPPTASPSQPPSRTSSRTPSAKAKRRPARPPGTYVKRPAVHAAITETDIYVRTKSNQRALQLRAKQLYESPAAAFTIHGLGAALPRAVDLGLWVQRHYPQSVTLAVTTDSVTLYGEHEPTWAALDADPTVTSRINSAIHIVVHKVMRH
ncbi:hypothetical protein CXG81DRAFT_17990 [Caulochytrium protostelioides]|uniref:Uncharacterized protein n=1 Tax=Caulochytrium protostelioides TaxID=1555241 RepID=A0A4P9XAG9_9FUNG|nr:hypothetical protein CXG81DRAFT_17990 [Caulochytrium protostelioides]|eukprot:RKP02325.1 hypothetical protein CXG81DRAFT_17990 [Caulochytrium protostelioides]